MEGPPYSFFFDTLLDSEYDVDFPARHKSILATLEGAGFQTDQTTLLFESVGLYAEQRGIVAGDNIPLAKEQLVKRIKYGDKFLGSLDPLPGALSGWADLYMEGAWTPEIRKNTFAYLNWARKTLEGLKAIPLSIGEKPNAALNNFLLALMKIWLANTGELPIAWVSNASDKPGGNILPMASECVSYLSANEISAKAIARRIQRLTPKIR